MHELTTDLCRFLNIAMQLWFFQCRQTQAIVAHVIGHFHDIFQMKMHNRHPC